MAQNQNHAFSELLTQALTEPGIISSAYSAFHGYSIGNQILAFIQCLERGIKPGPIATFMGWKGHGRFVRKGEKAIVLCMPVTCKRKASEPVEGEPEDKGGKFTRFIYRPNWFVLTQTEGDDFTPEPIGDWDATRALAALDIKRIDFENTDGNVQGYAKAREVAVSPVAVLPYKTLIHEVAHVLLGHTAEAGVLADGELTPRSLREVEAELTAFVVCQALGLPGADESRGYVQEWNKARDSEPLPERSAQKILKAADQILRAGRPAESEAK